VGEIVGINDLLFCIHAAGGKDFVASDDVGFDDYAADILGKVEHVGHNSGGVVRPMILIVGVFKKSFAVVAMGSGAAVSC